MAGMNVADLRPGMPRVDIRVRVLSISEPIEITTREGARRRLVEVEVGDLTGTTLLTLWEERIGSVKVGDVVQIENGFVSSFKGAMRLNVGKYGKLTVVKDLAFPTAEQIRKK